MAEVECGSSGGQGIGAGHVCRCIRAAGHPLDSARPHGCPCGALWRCEDCYDPDARAYGCAECGALPLMTEETDRDR